MEFIIDNRESLKDFYEKKNLSYVKFENLDLGDYIFKYDEEIILIIERKTIEDLAGSIKDGRHREQKKRLLDNYPKEKILYLLEGDFTKNNKSYLYNKVNNYTIYSSVINTLLRDNLKIFNTKTSSETIVFFENLCNKLNKGTDFLEKTTNYKDELSKNINIKKKENITPELVYRTQLSIIPNISLKTADVIIEKYPTFKFLINELENLERTERITLIQNLKYETQKGKFRKLGVKIGENIDKFLFN